MSPAGPDGAPDAPGRPATPGPPGRPDGSLALGGSPVADGSSTSGGSRVPDGALGPGALGPDASQTSDAPESPSDAPESSEASQKPGVSQTPDAWQTPDASGALGGSPAPGASGASGGPSGWAAVDAYFGGLLVPSDPALDAALEESRKAGLVPHAVAPNQGKLLHLLARIRGARTVLEIGTLGGYSTIWLARALPEGGRVVTLEADERCARVAAGNLARAGLAGVVEIRTGPALDSLPRLAAEGCGPFDVVFIDADKQNNPRYLEWALRLTRPGSLIIGDNVVREGHVVDAACTDARVHGVRRFTELLAAEPRVSATAVQTVGSKGWDGFVLALVTG